MADHTLGEWLIVSNGRRVWADGRITLSRWLLNNQEGKCANCSQKIYVRLTSYFDEVRWGEDDAQLVAHLHHKDKNHKNNQIENIELLCASCHSLLHRHWRKPQLKLKFNQPTEADLRNAMEA